jgi:diaminopimelate epimerase
MSTIRLSKLHGAGNDFLVWNPMNHDDDDRSTGDNRIEFTVMTSDVAARLCDRHRGIGADGLLVLWRSFRGGDCSMDLYNADGSPAEMSGNGIRCLAWVANRAGLGDGKRLTVDTTAGRREVALELDAAGDVTSATVDMGAVTFEPAEIPLDAPSPFELEATFHGVTYEGDAAGIGNPHYVLFVDDPAEARVTQHGPRLEHDDRFPNATNVEFVAVTGENQLTMRVWERGVGETLSCGTGVCAAAAVAHGRGLVGADVVVRVPGGEHRVEVGETVRLHGPVVHVFDTEVEV